MTWTANHGFKYSCQYCNEKFRRKATLLVHWCEVLRKTYSVHTKNLKSGKPGRQ